MTDKTIADALCQAQINFKPIKKNCSNPYFGSRYADLAAIIEATRPALTEQGIACYQIIVPDPDFAVIDTVLARGGQEIRSTIKIKPVKSDPQGMGSALSYARRYALAAILGVAADDDDDGNLASVPQKKEPIKEPTITESNVKRAEKIAEQAKPATTPVADKIVGVYLDATEKNGTSARGPWAKTTYIVEVEGSKQFISVFGGKKEVKTGDVLIFTGVSNSMYGRTASKVEKEQPPKTEELVESQDSPF
jgi:hypothetical protein